MNKYGLRIGNIGVEFSDQQTREKALILFSKGNCFEVLDCEGPRFKDSKGAFSTYERENNEQLMNCSQCQGVFSSEACTKRNVPARDWNNVFQVEGTDNKFLCDACNVKILKDFEVHKAKKALDVE